MAKPSLLLLLFFAFWTTMTALAVLTAHRSVPSWVHKQLWEDVQSQLASIMLPAFLLMLMVFVARLSLWETGTPSGPSDLDRLLQVKRMGLWRAGYRMLGQPAAVPTAAAPAAAASVQTTDKLSQGGALDRLVAGKRQRVRYPSALPYEDRFPR